MVLSFSLLSNRVNLGSVSLFRLFSSHNAKKKKIVFLGTPDCAALSLKILINESKKDASLFDVIAAVSQPPAIAGRNKKLTKSPVQLLAESSHLELFTPESAKDSDFLANLEAMKPDLCITAAYGNFLPQTFLDIPRYGTLNIHPSLLPKYRGAAPVQRCLENGDSVTGVSVAFTVLKMDAGPIVQQIERKLEGYEKSDQILNQMITEGTHALVEVLPLVFDGTMKTIPQVDKYATKAPKLTTAESRLDFSFMNALSIHNKVRAFSSWPGTWSILLLGPDQVSSRVKIITTKVIDPMPHEQQSRLVEVLKIGKKDILKVVCGDGSLLGIIEIQPEGKKIMAIRDLVNGLRGSKDIRWDIPPPE